MPERYPRLQSSNADRPAPVPAFRRWIRRSDGVVRCWFVVAIVIPSLPDLARAGELEGEVGLGIGVTAFGGRRSTGGFTLMPSGSIGWRFAEWGSLRYRNALPIFNLTALPWIGVIDMNTALIGLHLGRVMLELGPSLDVFTLPLCANTWCQREHGLAAGGHLGAVLFPTTASRFVAGETAHLTYLPGIAWSGLSVSVALEGQYRW
jgi:hypothetical protein